MYTHLGITILAISISANVCASEKNDERYGAIPLQGHYLIYGGTLAEMTLPTRKDRKISFELKGALAKDLFNQIGPDAKVACSSATDYRERRRGDLDCTFTRDDGYTCHIGLDVTSGKSTIGSIC